MFARITTIQVQPGKTDDLIRIFQDVIVPAAMEQKGFNGITLLTAYHTGKVMVVGLWESKADLLAGEGSGAYQEQLAKVTELLARPPVREAYEVSVQVEMTEQGTARVRGI